MWRIVKREIIDLTAERADEFLQRNIYFGQRKLSRDHVRLIKRAIEEKTFRTGEISTGLLKENNHPSEHLLLNGQHQLTAVKETGITIPALIEEIECENMDDVATLYATFDQGGRIFSDLIVPKGKAAGISWPDWFQKLILVGGLYKDGRQHWDKQKKVECFNEYIPSGICLFEWLQFNGNVERKNWPHLAKRAIFATFIIAIEEDKITAKNFVIQLISGANLDQMSASKILRDFLIALPNKKIHERDIFLKCKKAWNAFKEGKTTDLRIRKPKKSSETND